MIYEIRKGEKVFEVDDTVFFKDQPRKIKNAFNECMQGDNVEFDNAYIILLISGRIIITIKDDEDGEL